MKSRPANLLVKSTAVAVAFAGITLTNLSQMACLGSPSYNANG